MIKCSKVKRLLSSYVDGEVKEATRTGIEVHLAQCPDCRNELKMLKADQELLISVRVREISPYFTTRTLARIKALRDKKEPQWALVRVIERAGAALLVLLGIGLGILLGTGLARNNGVSQEVAALNAEPSIEELFTVRLGGE